MSVIEVGFIIQRPPYKSETSTLGVTHAISYQVVDMLLEEGQGVTPKVCFIGEGVLNCISGQKAMENYGVTSIESHIKNALLVDLDLYVCKEDLERFGISEDRLIDAEDMGADKKLQVVPFSEIQKILNNSKHLLVF
ncbi:MAG: DsrE family protein [Thermodesulfovibrionales bacterium]|nr:DsrE family protein [Thermodesulfovibrionales bacterium]